MPNELWAVSAVDGRYHEQVQGIGDFLSEGALILYRLRVEKEWLGHLLRHPQTKGIFPTLDPTALNKLTITKNDATEVKQIERTTNHDVKAVEYHLRRRLTDLGIGEPKILALVHFACTSEDINNISYALMVKDLWSHLLRPSMLQMEGVLRKHIEQTKNCPMLARTHGQTASPTTLGKELAVFGHRLQRQRRRLEQLPIEAKINGAVGNYNAHVAACPDVDWPVVSRDFLEHLGLRQNPLTTQIENHDSLGEWCAALKHYNTVLLGLMRDMWGYISLGYFTQTVRPGEVGSSTMPHKVNPIDFENAEGNLGVASSLLGHFSEKLLVSRWQRDLSDSTVLRALGTAIGHTVIAWRSAEKGLAKVQPREAALRADLESAWEVIGEAVQTVMRRHGVSDAYEQLKAATRGQIVSQETIRQAVESCAAIPELDRKKLLNLRPEQYVGLAPRLVDEFLKTADRT